MNIDQQLLEKYFKGKCTDAEQELVEAYLSHPETEALDNYLMATWLEVATTDADTAPAPKRKTKIVALRYWYTAAAAIVGVLGLIAWLWQPHKLNNKLAAANRPDTMYNTGNKVQLYTMPDGSEVWLNAHSYAIYNEGYNQQHRELWLSGEGYFKVVKNDASPFIVHAGPLTTTVLGTEFNIATSNRADGSIEVGLVSGKVNVSVASGPYPFTQLLAPGQTLHYKRNEKPVVQQLNTATTLDWMSGKIVFDNTKLSDAFAELQSRWGTTILLADSGLAGKRVAGEFKMSLPLDQVLATLGYVHDFTYIRTSDSTYLVKRKNTH
jgi:ferric-dicitrate binding protein FerR (iron transport regulator)